MSVTAAAAPAGAPAAGSRRQEACCAGSPDLSYDDRRYLGDRRRQLTRRVALAGSSALCAASVAFSVPSRWRNSAAAYRLAWGSAVWGLPLVLRQGRRVLTGRGSPWPFAGQLSLIGVGLAGAPWAPAVAAVAARAMEARKGAEDKDHQAGRCPPLENAALPLEEPQAEETGGTCRRSCS